MPIHWKYAKDDDGELVTTFVIVCDVCGREVTREGGGGNVLFRSWPEASSGPVAFAHKGTCDRKLDPDRVSGWNEAGSFVVFLARNFFHGTKTVIRVVGGPVQ